MRLQEAEGAGARGIVGGRPAIGAEVHGGDRPADDVDIRVTGVIRVDVARQLGDRGRGDHVDGAGQALEGGPQRPLPTAVRGVRTLAAPASDPVMAAPRRPVDDPHRRQAVARGVGDDGVEGHDVEAAVRVVRAGDEEALEEEVAELLVVAVQLAVGRDHREGRVERRGPAAKPGSDALASEAVGVGGRLGLERHRSGQTGVVEDRDDPGVVSEVDPVRATGVDPRFGGLPRGKDRVGDPLARGLSERGPIDGRLRQPDPGRSPPEPQLVVADAPRDLGPPVGG